MIDIRALIGGLRMREWNGPQGKWGGIVERRVRKPPMSANRNSVERALSAGAWGYRARQQSKPLQKS